MRKSFSAQMAHNCFETDIINPNYFCFSSQIISSSPVLENLSYNTFICRICVCCQAKGKESTTRTGGEEKRGEDRRPGENVILVSRVTQRPWLPDGALEGLAKAALGPRSQRSTN